MTLLVNLTQKGHAIGKLASLTSEQLRQFNEQSAVPAVAEPMSLLSQVIEALSQYRIDRCEQLLKKALIATEPLDYVRDVLLPALQKVGQLWHDDKLNIAQEHMFSSCVKRIVMSMLNTVQRYSRNNPGMLFATTSGEPHEFGILVTSLLAASQGYNCYYLGADLPARDIIDACEHLRPDVIVMGLIKIPPEPETIEQLRQIIAAAEVIGARVWLGGSGADHWYPQYSSELSHCELIADIDHFNAKAQQQILSS